MSIEVTWDNEEKTIAHYDYGKDWTWEDFAAANKSYNEMLAGVDHPVDVIADFTGGTSPPMGALGRFKAAQEDIDNNAGAVVVVGGGLFINSLVSAFSQVYKAISKNLMVAGSVEEAREKIAKLRAKS
jgi:hypothetical protein